jgi:hypothetical protein
MPNLDYHKLIEDLVLEGPHKPVWNELVWHQHFDNFCKRELHLWPDNKACHRLLAACAYVAASVVREDFARGHIILQSKVPLTPELILGMGLWEQGIITNTLSLEAAEGLAQWWSKLGIALGQLKSDVPQALLQESCARAIALASELTILEHWQNSQ